MSILFKKFFADVKDFFVEDSSLFIAPQNLRFESDVLLLFFEI